MATHTRLQAFKAAVDRRVARIEKSVEAGYRELVAGGVIDHAQLTSGRISAANLARMGHPFARKSGLGNSSGMRGGKGMKRFKGVGRAGQIAGQGKVALLPINRQTGRLRGSFSKRETPDRTVMGFQAPYAGFVLSPTGIRATMRTSKRSGKTYRHGGMVARGFYSLTPTGTGAGMLRKRWKFRLASIRRKFRAAH